MNEKSDNSAISELNPAAVIAQALPYMQRYTGKIIVVKLGGNAMIDEALGRAFARDVVLLRQSGALPVIVHGGGPQIGSMLKQLGIKSEFRRGLRVTDKKTMEIVEMVLAGSINKEIVRQINNEGGRAVGICGKDGKLVTAGHVNAHAGDQNASEALGYVGIPQECDPEIIIKMIGQQLIPVVAPVASGDDGATYNINADTFAGALAGALGAARLLLLTDVPGVLDKQGNLLTELRCADIEAKIKDGTIHGGMIPKIETCTKALALGVGSAVILDGRAPHSVLLELLTNQGKGTMIQP